MSFKEPSKNNNTRKPTSERELTEMIRRQLARPMNKRTNFLRVRLPNGGSCL